MPNHALKHPHRSPVVVALAAAATLAAGIWGYASAAPTGKADQAAAPNCPSVGTNWTQNGLFQVTTEQSGSGQTIYRPTQLAQQGCAKNPVIIWGNGTGATPTVYDQLLRHWASQGFIVAAANTTQSGSGQEMLAGLDYLTQQNKTPGSVYYGKVATDKVGAAGHSQGGGGTIAAGADPRVDVTIPIQPGPQGDISKLHSPMFILAGQQDTIVNPDLLVKPRFNQATQIPAVFGELAGATHFTTIGNAGGFNGPMTAWFRYWLMGDTKAKSEFFGPKCGYCADQEWTQFSRNAKAEAIS